MSESDEEPMDQVIVVPLPSAPSAPPALVEPAAPPAMAAPAPSAPQAPAPAPPAAPAPAAPAPFAEYTTIPSVNGPPPAATDPNATPLASPTPHQCFPPAGNPYVAMPTAPMPPGAPPVATPAPAQPNGPPMAPLGLPQSQVLPGMVQSGGVAMVFTSSPLHPRPTAPMWGPPAAGIPFGNLCTACQIRPPNPGRSWCQGCFLRGQGKAVCLKCDAASPPSGKTLCTPCWRASNNLPPAPAAAAAPAGLPLCTSCNQTPANTGYAWCERCFTLNRSRSIPQHLACSQCQKKHKNPGYGMCQGCFLESKGRPVCLNCKNAAPCYRSALCSTCTSTKQGAYRALPSTPCLNCNQQLPNRKPICHNCSYMRCVSKKTPFFINIPHSDPRFLDIQNHFFSKGFGHTAQRIVSIQAIYNPKAHTSYKAYKQSLIAQRGGGDDKAAVNERRMFKAFQPMCNLSSSGRYCHAKACSCCRAVKAGFAMTQDAEHGMYGKGIYFSFRPQDAHRALHSNGQPGLSVMMLCKVAVGQVEKCVTPQTNARGSARGCNSILGQVAGGPECVVVHANAASLPAYLITYQH